MAQGSGTPSHETQPSSGVTPAFSGIKGEVNDRANLAPEHFKRITPDPGQLVLAP